MLSLDRDMLARILPFALYILLLLVESLAADHLPGFDARWLYPLKIALVVLALWIYRDAYSELRQRPDARWTWVYAPLVGLAVFVLWINMDFGWLVIGEGTGGYDPRDAAGAIDWRLALLRIAGAALVVPLMEELFWRSFIMRWIDKNAFLSLAPAQVSLRAVLISSVIFGFEHSLWAAGIVAGLAYAWLYRASGTLWAPIVAHAVTNLVLGLWVLHTGAWQFW
jgi:uncharacterized protein